MALHNVMRSCRDELLAVLLQKSRQNLQPARPAPSLVLAQRVSSHRQRSSTPSLRLPVKPS